MSVLLETSLGVLVIDLYIKERPKCSLNFVKLCQMKYYNFCIFHSVQKNLVAQTGDPTGTGRMGASVFEHVYGDQAKYFEAEKKPKISHTRRGLVSMVDNGHGQHGSQFFFTLADHLEYLDLKHTVFGQVAEGLEFLDHINDVYCDQDNRPFRNVRIHHTVVLDDPFENPKGLRFPGSPARFPATLFGDFGAPRIEEDEELEEAVGLSPSQLNEYKAEQEAKTHAQLLTLIGDLPDADVKPPDNVLFVCRLNPVTNSEDLEIIFSRFGPIKSCEVIRDRRTDASLQYAFIEFENDSDCENAFLKMDKVVIDDRRIHVDFSQSVSKEWQRYRQQRAFPTALKDSQSSGREHHGPVRQTEPYHRAHRRSSSPRPKRTHQSKPKLRDGHSKRHQSPSPLRRLPERFEEQKHKPLPGTDLDLIVSESDEDLSSSSSQSRIRRKKSRRHRHRSRSNESPHKIRHNLKHKKHERKKHHPR
ncbi:Peptidyl prolyl cis trans isomerase 4 [Paragonimus heterotremus]|uniref:Peptidyl-prolyl cis-trans isomerase n=1 Tax=Paragonimus heterotremus TaxID=100268 RepID=A0A8J4WNU5_9TREM|nr:Peptidyl prolyl cis trans isomerase 4 [Paragonimus heterotremus]